MKPSRRTRPGSIRLHRPKAQTDRFNLADPAFVNQLRALSEPGEGYSDVIFRLKNRLRKEYRGQS